jgi:hypothetical protein
MPNISVELLQTYDDSDPPLTTPPTPISYSLRRGKYPIKNIVSVETKDTQNPSANNTNQVVDSITTEKRKYYLVPNNDMESLEFLTYPIIPTSTNPIPDGMGGPGFDAKLQLIQLFQAQQNEFISKIDDLYILNEELDLPRIPRKSAHNFDVNDQNTILTPQDILKCGIIVDKHRQFDFVRWGVVPQENLFALNLDPGNYIYTTFEIQYTYLGVYSLTGDTKEVTSTGEELADDIFKRFGRIKHTISLPFFLIIPSPNPGIPYPVNEKNGKPYPRSSKEFKPFYRDIYKYLKDIPFNNFIIRPTAPPKQQTMPYHNAQWEKLATDIRTSLKNVQNIVDRFNTLGTGSPETHANFGLRENCGKDCWKFLKHSLLNAYLVDKAYISSIALISAPTKGAAKGFEVEDIKDYGRSCRMFFSLAYHPVSGFEFELDNISSIESGLGDKNDNVLRVEDSFLPLEPQNPPIKPNDLEDNDLLADWNKDGCGLIPDYVPRVYSENNDGTPNPYSKLHLSELTKFYLAQNTTLGNSIASIDLTRAFDANAKLYTSRDDDELRNRYSDINLERIDKTLEKIEKYQRYGIWYKVQNNGANITPELVEIKDEKK